MRIPLALICAFLLAGCSGRSGGADRGMRADTPCEWRTNAAPAYEQVSCQGGMDDAGEVVVSLKGLEDGVFAAFSREQVKVRLASAQALECGVNREAGTLECVGFPRDCAILSAVEPFRAGCRRGTEAALSVMLEFEASAPDTSGEFPPGCGNVPGHAGLRCSLGEARFARIFSR